MGLALLLAATLQTAATGPVDKVYDVAFAPLAPSERRFAGLGPAGPYYPDRASRAEQNGEARLRCVAGANGDLLQCAILAETPQDSGFGLAARILADRKRVRATAAPTVGEPITVRVPFVRGAPVTMMGEADRVRPVNVSAPGVRGHAEVACNVADKALERCDVRFFQTSNRTPTDISAAAAIQAADQVSLDGLTTGTWVIIPVDVAAAPKPKG